MINIKLNIDLSGLEKYENAFKLGGPLQTHLDKIILQGITPYLPLDKGRLTVSGIASSKPGTGLITWSTPYAKAIWFGKTKDGKDMKFNTSVHRLAGPMWAERYKADNNEMLRQEIIRKVKGLR